MFEVEGSNWPKRQCYILIVFSAGRDRNITPVLEVPEGDILVDLENAPFSIFWQSCISGESES